MDSCQKFSKEHPGILAVLTFCFMWGLLRLMGLLPNSPLRFATREIIMAVAVFIVAFLFMGKEKVSFSLKGFGYGFRLLRGYFIFMGIITVLGILLVIAEYAMGESDTMYELIPFINVTIASLFVGIVEEFTFRGLIFGSLLQKFGNAKKSIILAAFISGLLFGVLHVLDSALTGEITNAEGILMAVLKIMQTSIMGVVLAFVYYKTRNLFAIAAIHSLDDYLILITTGAGKSELASYVATDKLGIRIGAYVLFTLVLVPALVKCIRNTNQGEAIPFDADFQPRKVEFVKKSKKSKQK